MSAPASARTLDERLALLDGMIYADGFGCAATLDELCRYSRIPIEREELVRLLGEDPALRKVVAERDGYFCFTGHEALLAERPGRIARARELRRRASRVARVLRHVPFVRGLLLTGSTAADNAGPDADVDVLVVVAPGRLATVFLVLGTTSRLLGRDLFCPNYYLAEDHLAVGPETLYVAREVVQATALVGDPDGLRQANPWVSAFLPNDRPRATGYLAPGGSPLERPLRGAFGDRVERWARRVAHSRLHAHHGAAGEAVPAAATDALDAGASLRFHRGRRDAHALERHAALRAWLVGELERRD